MDSKLSFDEDFLMRRDFVPSSQDVPLVNQHIGAVEREILGLRESIVQLQLQHSARVKVLKRLRFSCASIRKLPLELLTEIFHWVFLLYQEDDPESDEIILPWSPGNRPWQFNISQTCFLWRQAALDSSFLWRKFLLVAPGDGFGPDDEEEQPYAYEDKWVEMLGDALKLVPLNGKVTACIDLERSGWEYYVPCKLAIEHLYNPLMRTGRSVSIGVRGRYGQLSVLFGPDLEHPELLEHLVVRDLGHRFPMEDALEGGSQRWFKTTTNLRRIDFIAENPTTVLFDDTVIMYEGYPWEQLTHLVYQDPEGKAMLGTVGEVVECCKNLVSLTLLSSAIPENHGNWLEDDDIFDPDDKITLSRLRELVIDFEVSLFFQEYNLPSLASVEIRAKEHYSLKVISSCIKTSNSPIESFTERCSKPRQKAIMPYTSRYGITTAQFGAANRWKTTPELFENFIRGMPGAKTFQTITILTFDDLTKIATGELLPCVEVLRFYTTLPLSDVVEVLRPRFVEHSLGKTSTCFSPLKEVFVVISALHPPWYYSRAKTRPLIYVDGTRIETTNGDYQRDRIQSRPDLYSWLDDSEDSDD